MNIAGLFLYPVKGLRGFPVTSAEVDALGFIGDRRFLIVEETGKFMTQRTHPRMARIATELTASELVLRAVAGGSFSVPLRPDPAAGEPLVLPVSVWRSEGLLAEDCGDDVAMWLSIYLGHPCRLVRIGERFHRPVLKPAALPGDVVTFADSVPFLVVSEASLADLNDRLLAQHEDAVPMDRFRPNLVVTGCAAFAEDTWPRFRAGSVVFRAAGTCVRCLVPTIDQLTGERGKEPIRTLATYRRAPAAATDVIFGQNLIHETKSGTVRVGDAVELLG